MTARTLTGLLAKLGGYTTVLTGIFSLLISNYQSFVFDKSMLKKLYFQQEFVYDDKNEDGNLKDDDVEMIDRIKNREEFWFGYFGYGLMSITTKCCCCLKKRWLQKWPYYKKQWYSYEKFKAARIELNREKDIENMIYNMRINKFMQKTHLKKRQRDSVQYFMKYVIEDHEIKKKEIERRQATA